MLLNAAEDRATLRSDLSADRGDFKAESDAASVALFFYAKIITLCGKLQSAKLIISQSGKHRFAGRKAAARKEESSKTHKESGNSPCEIPSYIIGLEAQPQY